MANQVKSKTVDRVFLGLVVFLVSIGIFVFTSASFGLFARKGFSFQDLFFDQMVLGLVLGVIAVFVIQRFPLKLLERYALHIFIGAAVLTLGVFVPGLGFEHGGAHRWITAFGFSFQPSVVLQLATVIYLAALIPTLKDKMGDMRYSMAIAGGVLAVPAIILLAQPDTGTFMVIFVAACAMLLAGGMKIRHFIVLFLIAVVAVGVLALVRPYVKERLLTFFDPSHDPLGSSYQIQKSLVAIGSGGITGRGFGQSIQKFGSLPEPTGDSIFAVAGEEFGFIGGSVIILAFLLFGIRGLQIARRVPDMFSALLAVGVVILIVWQSFTNIAAMLGLIPLTGVPLVFMSHGGTALLMAFVEIGILLSISKLAR